MTPKDTDPFEEFEFRPLTEGLGFHGKAAPAARSGKSGDQSSGGENPAFIEINENRSAAPQADRAVADLPTLKSPLPRKRQDSKEQTPPATKKVEDLLSNLQKKPYDFETTESGEAEKQKVVFQSPANYDYSALVLDAMLLVAGFLTCLIVLLMVTKIDLVESFTETESSLVLGGSLASLFLFLTWIYLVVNRVFLGATPGEWVFDRRLGRTEQMGTFKFVGQVLARSTLVILTGLILIPLASLIMNKDLLGKWLGLELHQV